MPATLAALAGAAPAVTAGQLWLAYETGGYMYSDNLSDFLRIEVQSRCRFRQFCDLPEQKGSNAQGKGEQFAWNIYGDLPDAANEGELAETDKMPTTRLEGSQGTCTVTEFGTAVPYSGKLDDLSAHPVRDIIKKSLERHCARSLDGRAHKQWAKTPLKVIPAGGNSATDITITENGTAGAVNDASMTASHVSEIVLQMTERDIPTHKHGDYYCIARPTTYRVLKKDLENKQQYTETGFGRIVDGEKGRYDGVRFVDQTNIETAAWANGKSNDAYFFGDDVAAECCVIPEEIRGKIPDDYGRGKGVAWYYLGNFALTRTKAEDTRVIHWATA